MSKEELIKKIFDIWKPIICDEDGNYDFNKIKEELSQYYIYLQNTKKLYIELFNLSDGVDYPADFIITYWKHRIKQMYVDKAELKALLDEYQDVENIELLLNSLKKLIKNN